MIYSKEVENMCTVAKGPKHGPAPIPEEGKWVKSYDIKTFQVFHTALAGVLLSRVPASLHLMLKTVSLKRLLLKQSVVRV